ncbi:MAG: hypothetical protein IT424_06115 [Pirellulales bacterium]|nr:hypothetical protein [Pirellulales bacterium]
MSTLQKTARIGSLISFVALAISLLLPWWMGPGVSWEEASFGYIPAGVALVGFQLLHFFADSTATSAETNAAAAPGSTRRAVLNVLATAAVVGGGVGAAYSAVGALDSRSYAIDSERRAVVVQQELTQLRAEPTADEQKIEDLEDELQWGGPESHWADVRFFAYCAAGSGALALVGLGWLIHAYRSRR